MMRVLVVLLIAGLPGHVLAHERALDTSKRAKLEAWPYSRSVTEAEFNKMRRHYDPASFQRWVQKLSILREGMTAQRAREILKPKEVIEERVYTNGTNWNTWVLDEAYYIVIRVDVARKRIIQWTPPAAITYDVH